MLWSIYTANKLNSIPSYTYRTLQRVVDQFYCIRILKEMAEGLFLLEKLQAFGSREWNLQENIRRDVHELKMEMQTMEALMRDADAKKDHDERFKVWIQEVRTQAYAIEEVLDLFKLQQAQDSVWNLLLYENKAEKNEI